VTWRVTAVGPVCQPPAQLTGVPELADADGAVVLLGPVWLEPAWLGAELPWPGADDCEVPHEARATAAAATVTQSEMSDVVRRGIVPSRGARAHADSIKPALTAHLRFSLQRS